MADPVVPAIPLRLRHRPVVAGLVVPWITACTPEGRYRFGSVDAGRAERALVGRWCQTCGQRLDRRFVFAMRAQDVKRSMAAEAAMHPECFHYSILACPMLAGRMDHYRGVGSSDMFAGVAVVMGDPHDQRADRPAEPWYGVWARDYTVITDPIIGLPAALLLPGDVVRVRLSSPRFGGASQA